MESESVLQSPLAVRAKRFYESGRILRALRRGVLVVPMLLVALLSSQPGPRLWLAGAFLFAAVVLFSVRGKSAGRAVPFALLAGLAPLLLPIGVRAIGHAACSEACMTLCLPACYAGGAIAGALLGLFSRLEENAADRREFLFAAISISAVAGALGCSVVGAGGVLGMLAAELLVAAPALRTVH